MEPALVDIDKLKNLITSSALPNDLKERAFLMVNRAGFSLKLGFNLNVIDQITRYIQWICALPWQAETEDNLDLKTVAKTLEQNHYGLAEIKERILEYIAVLKLLKSKNEKHYLKSPVLCFVGLAGTGKTTIAASIAQSLGRKFVRIPLGGMGSAVELRGMMQTLPNAEPGQIIRVLRRLQVKNPVILLDEIDRVSEHARSDIMGVLLELLDPEQNSSFTDNYIDYPFDLSHVLFVATANNTNNISTAVLDRLEPLQMPSYSDEEKIIIGKNYMLKKVMKESGLEEGNLVIDENVWPQIVRPLGFDSGIRSLERTIQSICRKVAKKIISGEGEHFHLTLTNIKEFIVS